MLLTTRLAKLKRTWLKHLKQSLQTVSTCILKTLVAFTSQLPWMSSLQRVALPSADKSITITTLCQVLVPSHQ